MIAAATPRRRGGPLAVLGVLLAVWIAGRAVLWESPFPIGDIELPTADILFAEDQRGPGLRGRPAIAADEPALARADAVTAPASRRRGSGLLASTLDAPIAQSPFRTRPVIAAGHQFLMAAAFQVDWVPQVASTPTEQTAYASAAGAVSPVAPRMPERVSDTDRWSLDAFAFFRQGSGSTSISQGRVPVYGATQVGANLQYRVAPSSSHDPRVYIRGYRAFVRDGENEAAIGVSARPLADIPVRLAAELRATDNQFGTDIRPAAYAVTEIPQQRLPFDFRLEAYGGAGYVGGDAQTAFVDGQASMTREVISISGPGETPMRLSLGGGAWGGAQEDANRIDVGPTMRLDLTIGEVPARVSLDWRERVGGDAAPDSGVAATLSTRF